MARAQQKARGRPLGKILCFAPEHFADFEIVLALHILNGEKAWQTATVGYTHETVAALSGLRHSVDFTLEEAQAQNDIDAFLMPGGALRPPDDRLSAFLQTLHRRGVLLGAICFAPQYLAHSGLLNTHRYTTSCTPANAAQRGFADPFPRENYVEARVVTDRNIITAQGYAFVDFAFAVAKHLGLNVTFDAELRGFCREIMDR